MTIEDFFNFLEIKLFPKNLVYAERLKKQILITHTKGQPMNPFDPGYYNEDDLQNVGFKTIGRNVQISKICRIIGLDNTEIGKNVRIDDYCSPIAASGG